MMGGQSPVPPTVRPPGRARNRLPAVSWILPTSFQSEHPDYLPAAGAGTGRAPELPETAAQLALAEQEVATLPKPTLPGAGQHFPHQEGGHRPHMG